MPTDHQSWQIYKNWPDLFIIRQSVDAKGEPIYRVDMNSSLSAKFGALSRGTTNHQAGILYDALWRLHLVDCNESEFGSLTGVFESFDPDYASQLDSIDPFLLDHLKAIIGAVKHFRMALFPELRCLIYADRNAKEAAKTLENRFKTALETFGRPIGKAHTKRSNRLFAYKNISVSLPWLAIRCTYDFVIEHHRLPTKLELREVTERASQRKKAISRSTWSDALKTAGLSGLEEGKKFSSSRYRKKRVRKNNGNLRTTFEPPHRL